MEPSSKYALLYGFVRNHANWLTIDDLYRVLANCKGIAALRQNSSFVSSLCHEYLSPRQPYQRGAMKIIKRAILDYKNESLSLTEGEREYLNQV